MMGFMSSFERPEPSPFHGEATERLAGEIGSPLANIADETEKLRELARQILELPDGEGPSRDMIIEGLTALTKAYTVHYQTGERWDPFVDGRTMPVTSVMIMTTAMLQSVNIELFELGMWQAWARN